MWWSMARKGLSLIWKGSKEESSPPADVQHVCTCKPWIYICGGGWQIRCLGYRAVGKGQRSEGSKVKSSKSIMWWMEGWVGRSRYPWGLPMTACWWWIELEGIGGGSRSVGGRERVWTRASFRERCVRAFFFLCFFPFLSTRRCACPVCGGLQTSDSSPRVWCLSIQTAHGGAAGPGSTPEPIPEDSQLIHVRARALQADTHRQ